jgi:hypothetical protein
VASHPFDPVAFVFGGLALTAGVVVLAGGSLTDEARVLLPAGLITFGVAMFVKVARREPSLFADPTVDPFAPAAGPAGDDSDLDHLFAPVDDVLSRWDADRAAAGAPAGDTLVADDLDDPTEPATDADDTIVDPPDEITDHIAPDADDTKVDGEAEDADVTTGEIPEVIEGGAGAGPPDEEPPEEARPD